MAKHGWQEILLCPVGHARLRRTVDGKWALELHHPRATVILPAEEVRRLRAQMPAAESAAAR